MNKTTILVLTIILLAVVGGGMYWLGQRSDDYQATPNTSDDSMNQGDTVATTTDDSMTDSDEKPQGEQVIGQSEGGNDIKAYHFGTGEKELLFVGGIHGGYDWNTVLLAYELIDYLEDTPNALAEDLRVTIIPVLNPDGLKTTVGTTGRFDASDVPSAQATLVAGRYNANEVDLNRNFACDWQAEGTWRSQTVSGGTAAFSESEAVAFRDYVNANEPTAVVAWYSAAGGVFASNCHGGVLEETTTLTDLYADAAGYQAFAEFDFYEITGDMVNWLASEEIPAISVLLTNHTNVEWDKNRKGVLAVFDHYSTVETDE